MKASGITVEMDVYVSESDRVTKELAKRRVLLHLCIEKVVYKLTKNGLLRADRYRLLTVSQIKAGKVARLGDEADAVVHDLKGGQLRDSVAASVSGERSPAPKGAARGCGGGG